MAAGIYVPQSVLLKLPEGACRMPVQARAKAYSGREETS